MSDTQLRRGWHRSSPSLTASLRFGRGLNVDATEFQMDMVLYQRIYSVLCFYAPFSQQRRPIMVSCPWLQQPCVFWTLTSRRPDATTTTGSTGCVVSCTAVKLCWRMSTKRYFEGDKIVLSHRHSSTDDYHEAMRDCDSHLGLTLQLTCHQVHVCLFPCAGL